MLSEPISDKFVKKIFEPISKIFDTVKILVSVWVSVLVLSQSRNFVFLDGIGTGVEKIDTGKVSEKFGTEKSPRTGLVLIFGSLHTLMAT